MFVMVCLALAAMGLAVYSVGTIPVSRRAKTVTTVGVTAIGLSLLAYAAAVAYAGWSAAS
jgi:hypothetical protein